MGKQHLGPNNWRQSFGKQKLAVEKYFYQKISEIYFFAFN